MPAEFSDGRTIRRGPMAVGYSRFRWGLIGLAIALTVAVIVFFTLNAKHNADQAERAAEREMRNLSSILAEQAARSLAAVDVAVAAAAIDFSDRAAWTDKVADRTVFETLGRYAAADPAISRLLLLETDGTVRAASDTTRPGTSLAGRPFMAHAGDGVTLSVTDPPVADDTGCRWCVAIAAPVVAPDGRHLGLIVAELPRPFFEGLYTKIDRGRRSAFGIADLRGYTIARVPAVAAMGPDAVRQTPAFRLAQRAFQRNETLAERALGVDGIERLFAVSPVPGRGYVVYAGASPDDYLADWRRTLQISLPFAGLALAAFVFLILALAGHLGRLEESEQTVRLSDQRFQSLVANIPGVVFQRRLDPDGKSPLVWISAAVGPQLGYTADEVLAGGGKVLVDLIEPADRPAFQAAFERSALSMQSLIWTGRMRRRSGQLIWTEITARPRRADDGTILWDGISLDVTDRVAAEAALANVRRQLDLKKEQLELALTNMAQGMCVYDADLRLVVFNRRYLELYGLEDSGIHEGMTLEALMRVSVEHGNYSPEVADQVVRERLAAARDRVPRTLFQQLRNGRTVEVDIRPLEGGGSVASVTDISEREAAQETLRQAKEQAELADRSKSQFLANMSHELRTPLNAIIGFSEIMTDKLFGPLGDPRYEEYARDIRESGRHLLTLINDILDLSKIEARQANLREEQVSLAEVFEACVRLVADRAQRGGLDLHVGNVEDLPALWADRVKLKQILLNLMSNAVKFTPAGGTVTMDAKRLPGGGVAVSVADTGIGMRAQDIPAALQPFRQIETALSRKHEGTGLGLPLTKAIVEMHGGELSIESALGKGTTVTVTLPAERVIDPHGVTDAALAEAIHSARSAL